MGRSGILDASILPYGAPSRTTQCAHEPLKGASTSLFDNKIWGPIPNLLPITFGLIPKLSEFACFIFRPEEHRQENVDSNVSANCAKILMQTRNKYTKIRQTF